MARNHRATALFIGSMAAVALAAHFATKATTTTGTARAVDASTVEIDGARFTINGLSDFHPDAFTALRRHIDGQTVSCTSNRCAIGGDDLGDWLVSNGLARSADGNRYAHVEHAKARRLGVWSE